MTPTPFCLVRHDRWVLEFLMTLFEPSSTLFNRNIMWQFNGQKHKLQNICLSCAIEKKYYTKVVVKVFSEVDLKISSRLTFFQILFVLF